MKLLLTAAAAVTLLTTLAIPTPARAADDKMYHGSDCKVFGSTAWTDLAFSGYGVKNLATSARNIICPIVKDTSDPWDGAATIPTNDAYLSLRIQTGSVAASYACTVYVTTVVNTTMVNSYSITSGGAAAPNTIYDHQPQGFNSVYPAIATDKAYMLCTLGPSVRLLGYLVYEQGPTDY